MFHDIQQKLFELSSIEKCQREITEMKNVQLKTMQKLKEKTKEEQIATQSNKQLMDRIAQLESDLESQKLLNKDLKREKNQFEQQTLQNSAKVDQLQEVLKMFQPGQAQQPQHNMTPR